MKEDRSGIGKAQEEGLIKVTTCSVLKMRVKPTCVSQYTTDHMLRAGIKQFCTSASTLLRFVWKGTTVKPEYERILQADLKKNPKLPEIKQVLMQHDLFP